MMGGVWIRALTVIRHENDKRVVVLSRLLQILHHLADIRVYLIDHRRISLHRAAREGLLVVRKVLPFGSEWVDDLVRDHIL